MTLPGNAANGRKSGVPEGLTKTACFLGVAAMVLVALLVKLSSMLSFAQQAPSNMDPLPRDQYRSGEEVLRAFAPVSAATRHSIVKLKVNGETAVLGAVVDEKGLVLTKASEIRKGKLTAWLATEKEVPAEFIAADQEDDVALIKVHASGLKPVRWADEDVAIGEWAITPGLPETPHAVGIVSALPRRIRPPRALIGVRFDFTGPATRIQDVMPGYGAEKAGLKSGDLIVGLNDASVTNRDQLVETLRDYRDGQTVRLRIERDTTNFEASVRMTALAADTRTVGSRLTGNLSERAEGFEQAIEHDTVLQPWLCGGPLVNLDGKAIGLNIARAGRVTTYALPARLVKKILERLKANPQVH